MEVYAAILLYVIPGFFILMIVEIIYSHYKKNITYKLMDTLSSLSSGITNILKDSLGVIFIIISYPYLLEILAITKLESTIMMYFIAFVCIDFASYWGHRLNHSVNFFWNTHVIHHSSEEFNLACALRQSIARIIGFRHIFLIPAAIFGLPSEIIIILTPIHLFAQFWYHTQHIGKLGWLEYIIVTPSQHRVHHAINDRYIDKNLSAVFCIWDRLFGTFQEELDNDPPVYGVLKPVRTWNPIWINFQHFFNLLEDAWHTKKWKDKFLIWFMPTGWRPNDVLNKLPRKKITDINNFKKYNPKYTTSGKILALFHFIIINFFLFYLLNNFSDLNNTLQISIGLIIFISVFGYTSILDGHEWSTMFELIRSLIIISIILINYFDFFSFHQLFSISVILYAFTTILLTLKIKNKIVIRDSNKNEN